MRGWVVCRGSVILILNLNIFKHFFLFAPKECQLRNPLLGLQLTKAGLHNPPNPVLLD